MQPLCNIKSYCSGVIVTPIIHSAFVLGFGERNG